MVESENVIFPQHRATRRIVDFENLGKGLGGDICRQARLCLMPPKIVAGGICGSNDGKSAGMTGPNAPYGQVP